MGSAHTRSLLHLFFLSALLHTCHPIQVFVLAHSLTHSENNLPNGDFLKMAMISSPRLEKSGISLSALAFISTLCMGSKSTQSGY
mmetsp:Transcript_6414/g.12195  ORF Transcript_6414/g.12195 Transcript_6414/m.12195 type:complete len:85 (-) Transcript_6414:23-277(-)